MLEPTITTWILVIFGVITIIPVAIAQLTLMLNPQGQQSKDNLIGKGEDWRDKTHFRFAYGMAWSDWIIWLPLLMIGSSGVLMGTLWGYVLWAAAGAISIYINLVLWVGEREYVYPSCGPLAYYTYFWGNFIYWGMAALVYTAYRLSDIPV
ncbi:hypothetical protein ACFL27_24970 [candidate division CSSED10-310 bacterium]|uniref:Uncharacterized protein n=1 Tax=candidate division CSSED10-310 bacterium TaxID=2855610 RepID=A0ABV6Z4T6_UNCC1